MRAEPSGRLDCPRPKSVAHNGWNCFFDRLVDRDRGNGFNDGV